jgi:hypothetical protein
MPIHRRRRRDAELPGLSRSAFWLRYALESTGTTPAAHLQLGNQEIADAALFVTVADACCAPSGRAPGAGACAGAGGTLVLPFSCRRFQPCGAVPARVPR